MKDLKDKLIEAEQKTKKILKMVNESDNTNIDKSEKSKINNLIKWMQIEKN